MTTTIFDDTFVNITKFENDWNDTLIIKLIVMDEAHNFIKSRIGVYMGPYAG